MKRSLFAALGRYAHTALIVTVALALVLGSYSFAWPAAAQEPAPTAVPPANCNAKRDLYALFVSDDKGKIVNQSLECSYDVGMASYKKYGQELRAQEVFDWATATIGPNQSLFLQVGIPDCAAQIDMFYGPVIMDLSQERYGTRLLSARHIGGDNYCSSGPEPTEVLPTAVPPTEVPPTAVPPTPQPLADVYFNTSDSPLCVYDAQWMTVQGGVSLKPASTEARLSVYWQILNPEDLRNEPQYINLGTVTDGYEFSVNIYWPGIRPLDTAVEVHVGAMLYDQYSNEVISSKEASLNYYWYESVCEAPPTQVVPPTATTIPTVVLPFPPEETPVPTLDAPDLPPMLTPETPETVVPVPTETPVVPAPTETPVVPAPETPIPTVVLPFPPEETPVTPPPPATPRPTTRPTRPEEPITPEQPIVPEQPAPEQPIAPEQPAPQPAPEQPAPQPAPEQPAPEQAAPAAPEAPAGGLPPAAISDDRNAVRPELQAPVSLPVTADGGPNGILWVVLLASLAIMIGAFSRRIGRTS